MGVLHSFSIKSIVYDKMSLRLFYFHVTSCSAKVLLPFGATTCSLVCVLLCSLVFFTPRCLTSVNSSMKFSILLLPVRNTIPCKTKGIFSGILSVCYKNWLLKVVLQSYIYYWGNNLFFSMCPSVPFAPKVLSFLIPLEIFTCSLFSWEAIFFRALFEILNLYSKTKI